MPRLFCIPKVFAKKPSHEPSSIQNKLNYYLREQSRQFYLNDLLISDQTKDDQLSHQFFYEVLKQGFNHAILAEIKYQYLDKEIFCMLAFGMHKVYQAIHPEGLPTQLTTAPEFLPDNAMELMIRIIEAVHQYHGFEKPILSTHHDGPINQKTYTIQLSDPTYALPLDELYKKLMSFNHFMNEAAYSFPQTNNHLLLDTSEIELNTYQGLRKRK